MYLLARFLHFLSIVAAFGASTLLHTSLLKLRRVSTVAEASGHVMVLAKLGPRMPIFLALLFLTGSWLVTMNWPWSTPFVEVAIGGLVIMVVVSGAVMRPKLMALQAALAGAPDGPLPPAARAAIGAPGMWIAANIQPMIALGNMFVMVMKPTLPLAVAYLVGFIVVGAVSAVPLIPKD